MFASTYRVNAPEDGFDYEMVAIWTKLPDGTDLLHVIDQDVAADGPASVTVGRNWDFKDLDITLRADVAGYFHDLHDPDERELYDKLYDAVTYEQVDDSHRPWSGMRSA